MQQNKDLKRDLFLLHHGLVEIRKIALREGCKQIAILADALEVIPLKSPKFTNEEILLCLEPYNQAYPDSLPTIVELLKNSTTLEDFLDKTILD